MADNKEDLSTEQILSSIRDMLTDGDDNTPPPPVSGEENIVDDVLELTPDMIVNKAEFSNDVESKADEDMPALDVEEDVSDTPSNTIDTANEIVEEETIEDVTNSTNLSSTSQEPLVETVVEGQKENNFEDKSFPVEETKTVSADVNSEAIASNIIKAFSNMFSNIDIKPNNIQEQAQEQVDNYNKDALKSSISKAVENWVVENMQSDAGLQPLVREEVSKQVKVWLDGNLTNLITTSIKQELERVMEKVDNN